MVTKRNIGDYIFDSANYIFMVLFAVVCVYPLLYVVFASFSEPQQLTKFTGILLKPLGFTLAGYRVVLKNPNIFTGYMNTLFYVLVGTALSMLLTMLGAYTLSRKNLYIKKFFMIMIIITMYFGGGLIPSLLLVRAIGIYDTRLALILPEAITTWNMIVMRTAFNSVPPSLEESAKIDGANDFVILFKVILPVIKATTAVIALFYVVENWNSWLPAIIYIRSRSLLPLQVILREILLANSSSGNVMADASAEGIVPLIEIIVKYCTIIVATIPILCAYPFCQKFFIRGVMLGSLKE
ncbi:MAG: carbohydrate ABC transporter permease [Treponema sp.]|nr:carbohydrate ABC transporter permease [Treponema sp.]